MFVFVYLETLTPYKRDSVVSNAFSSTFKGVSLTRKVLLIHKVDSTQLFLLVSCSDVQI